MPTPTIAPAPAAPAAGVRAPAWTLLTALVPMVWGTTYIVTTHLLPSGHALFAALMRCLPAGLLAVVITRRLPRGSWWWRSLVLGTLNMGVFFPLLFLAAQRLPGGVAATLGAVQPLLVAALAIPLLGDRPSLRRFVWGIGGVVGVALVVLGPGARLDLVGVLAGLAGAASMGLGVVLTKRWGRPAGVSSLALAGWQLAAGGLVLLAPALLIDGVPTIDRGAWLGYAWLGIIGALAAYTVWFAGIRRLPVASTALLGLLSPLTAAAVGAVLAAEQLSGIQLVGFALALVAMVAGQLPTPSLPKGHDPS